MAQEQNKPHVCSTDVFPKKKVISMIKNFHQLSVEETKSLIRFLSNCPIHGDVFAEAYHRSEIALHYLAKNATLTASQISVLVHDDSMRRYTRSEIIDSHFLLNIARLPNTQQSMLKKIVSLANKFLKNASNGIAPVFMAVIAHANCTQEIIGHDIGKKWIVSHGQEPAVAKLLERFEIMSETTS